MCAAARVLSGDFNVVHAHMNGMLEHVAHAHFETFQMMPFVIAHATVIV
jgi:hypothetical protein